MCAPSVATDSSRLHSYSDDPMAIDCGENLIVHREGPEATPYRQNVIVSSTFWQCDGHQERW